MLILSQESRHRAFQALGIPLFSTTCGLSLLSVSLVFSGQLHQCQDSSGRLVFTDSPAQLTSCAPLTSGAQHTGDSIPQPSFSPPSPPHPTVGTSTTQPSAMIPVDHGTSAASYDPTMRAPGDPSTAPSPATPEPHCPLGLNPLNGFGAPPCPVPQDPHAPSNEAGPIVESPPL